MFNKNKETIESSVRDFKTYAKKIKSDSKIAARSLLGNLNSTEITRSGGFDYIIIEGNKVLTYDEAEALVRKAQENNQSIEDKTIAITVNLMETYVKERAEKGAQDNTNFYYVLYNNYLSYKAKELPLEKFKELTSKLNTGLGTQGPAKIPPFQQLAALRDAAPESRKRAKVIPGHQNIKSGTKAKSLFKDNFLDDIAENLWNSGVTGERSTGYFLQVSDSESNPTSVSLIRFILGWKRSLVQEGGKKTDGIIIDRVYFENLDPSLPRNPGKEYAYLNAGHWVAEKMQVLNLGEKYQVLEALITDGINPRTDTPFDPEHLNWLKSQLSAAKQQVYNSIGVDKLFGSYNLIARATNKDNFTKDALITPFIELAAALGSKEILIVEDSPGSTLTLPSGKTATNVNFRIVTLELEYSAEIQSYAEFARFNSLKGSSQQEYIDAAEKLFQRIVESMLEGRVLETGSPSLFTQVLAAHIFQALEPLLGSKNKKQIIRALFEKIPKKKRILAKHKFLNKPKAVNIDRVTGLIRKERQHVIKQFNTINRDIKSIIKKTSKAEKQLVAKSVSEPKKTIIEDTFDKNLLINGINRDIRDYVREQMVGGETLQYRTGKFARSVRALDVSENTVTFTYMKRPYEVFENTTPWSSFPERNPNLIIEKAIRALAQKKYPNVFRNPLNIIKG